MTPEQMKQIAELIAKGLQDAVPEAVEAAVDAKMKELNLSENADVKEIKEQLKSLVEKAKFTKGEDEDLEEVQEKFVEALKGIQKGDLSWIKAMSEWTAADGGYLVHPEFEKGVLRILGTHGIWKDCNVTRMAWNVKKFTIRSTGVQVFYTDEAWSINDTSIGYQQKELIAKKVSAILSATYELIEDQADASEIWNKAQEEFADAIDYFIDKEVLTGTNTWTGTSASKMLGVCNLSGVNVVTTSGASASSLTYDNLVDATRKIALKYKGRYNPCWYMSQDAIAIIEKLKDLDWRPLYRTLDNGEKWYLLGFPVKLTDVMPSGAISADTPFIVFGSLKFFGLGLRKGLTFELWYKSGNWEKDIKSLKGSARVCGTSLIDEAFSIIKTASSTPTPTPTETETETETA